LTLLLVPLPLLLALPTWLLLLLPAPLPLLAPQLTLLKTPWALPKTLLVQLATQPKKLLTLPKTQ
jgi:hypothetical protein